MNSAHAPNVVPVACSEGKPDGFTFPEFVQDGVADAISAKS
jgi:hypothetical protein